jgi:SAM-dependent methyltransferase
MKPEFHLASDHYEHAMRGFDLLAPGYDEEIGSNTIGNKMRQVLREMLLGTFRPGDLVLEIGCGTGIDAIFLAERGISVVATDLSAKMLDLLRAKIFDRGLSEMIVTRKLAANQVGKLVEDWGPTSFDGGFSHAGALNMEPRIDELPSQLFRLIRNGGHFICSVVNKVSLFEVLFYPLVLRPRKAFRRLDNVIPIPISTSPHLRRYVVPSRFFSTSDLKRIFAGFFSLQEVVGLQVFLPPHNLDDVYRRFRPLFYPMDVVENLLSKRFPANRLGHYTLAKFRRREGEWSGHA